MQLLVKGKAYGIRPYRMELSRQECVRLLEKIRWGDEPQCPYCGSKRASPIEKGMRHHCNDCFTSYSVTVGTIFHKTHVDLQRWFSAILLIYSSSASISVRKLALEIGVNKNTAARILKCLREADPESKSLIKAIEKEVRQPKSSSNDI